MGHAQRRRRVLPDQRLVAAGLLVQNNEYTDDVPALPRRHRQLERRRRPPSRRTPTACRSSRSKQGKRGRHDGARVAGRAPVAATPGASPARRRSTIGGPVAPATTRLKTSADPTGRRVLGTLNNCAMGYTPWGTYLACEENFNGYFRKTGDPDRRSSAATASTPPAPATSGTRPTRASTPTPSRTSRTASAGSSRSTRSTRRRRPVKRTALGRLKHEGAWVQEARDGRVVVYMGDDEQFEYIYRYVSNQPWRKALRAGHQPARRRHALRRASSTPTAPASGCRSRPTTPRSPAGRCNDILINTRGAADARRRHEDGPPRVDRHLPASR